MEEKHGNLSINSENIFPIIKKWMYSDKDIFIREMISNGCDAITKRKKLEAVGEVELPEGYKPKITVYVNDKEKTLKFEDNGIGMTADEVEKDITEIAFSGASEFLEKYKGKADSDQIIGHFGLGFYSAFMVADLVEIDTLSYQEGAEPVHWECDGGTDYDMKPGDRTEVGTLITLHISDDSLEYCNEYKVRETIEKYCGFMPTEIYLVNETAEPETETIDEKDLKDTDKVIEHIHTDAKYEEKKNDDGTTEKVETSPAKDEVKIEKRPVPVNDIHPLWTKQPSECTDEDYKKFYRKVFNDYKEPLFWIHLNMEYPFRLKGILYFPRITSEYESIEGKIKLYNTQVFIADNIKEVIPEYLLVLKGVIDCPDLPLNVSRSALQNDGFAQKISDYISKKVSDKLSGMFKTKREDYEKYWNDISPFIKYGILKDEKFAERMKDYVLYENLDGKYETLDEIINENTPEDEKKAEDAEKTEGGKEAADSAEKKDTEDKDTEEKKDTAEKKDAAADGSSEDEEEKPKIKIYYVTNEKQQSQYINMFRAQKKQAYKLIHTIDSPFISRVEQTNDKVQFLRIDSDVTDDMKGSSRNLKTEGEKMQKLFRKVLGKDQLNVSVENLKDKKVSAMVTISEDMRRYMDMMKMYGMAGKDVNVDEMETEQTLVLNAKHPLVKYVYKHIDNEDDVKIFVEQLYDLAVISNRALTPDEMTKFVARSNEIMVKLTEEDKSESKDNGSKDSGSKDSENKEAEKE
ncbi:MAG: molecular chaperone HtpG [Eubacteriales bacterium]|jgi:molecular chaperone HtpG